MNYNQGGQPAAESQQIRSESSDETVAKSGEGEKRERSKEKGERKKPKSAESGAQCGGSWRYARAWCAATWSATLFTQGGSGGGNL